MNTILINKMCWGIWVSSWLPTQWWLLFSQFDLTTLGVCMLWKIWQIRLKPTTILKRSLWPPLWNVSQTEDMVTLLLWNFARTVSSEGQWQCSTCAYQDMTMVKANHCSFCLPDMFLYPAHLEIIAVLEVYQCLFMGIYENTFSCVEIL